MYASKTQLECFDRWGDAYFKAYWQLNLPVYAKAKYEYDFTDIPALARDVHKLYMGDPYNRNPVDAVEWLHFCGVLRWTLKDKTLTVKLLNTPPMVKELEYVSRSTESCKAEVWRMIMAHFDLPYYAPGECVMVKPSGFDNYWDKAMQGLEPPTV